MVEKKQGELKNMPKRTALDREAKTVLDKWENLQGKKAELTEAHKRLMISMKNANRSVIRGLVDSDGIKRKIAYTESERITVTKDSPTKTEK